MTNSRDEWRTPAWLFRLAQSMFGPYVLDAAASDKNALCARFYDLENDGTNQEWVDGTWCPPPYSNITPWVDCAIEQDVRATLLIPSPNGEFRDLRVLTACSEIVFFQQRIAFINPDTGVAQKGNPRGSVLVHFDGAAKGNSPRLRVISKAIIDLYRNWGVFDQKKALQKARL